MRDQVILARLKTIVGRVHEILASGQTKLAVGVEHRWVREANGFFRRPLQVIYWPFALRSVLDAAADWQEYKDLQEAVDANPVFARHMNTLVGTFASAQRLELTDIIWFMLWPFLNEEGTRPLSEEELERAYLDLEVSFYSDRVDIVQTVPFHGLRLPIDRFQIDEHNSLVRLDDDEARSFLNHEIQLGPVSSLGFHPEIDNVALRRTLPVPKRIGPEDGEPPSAAEEEFIGLDLSRMLAALHLLTDGRFIPLGSMTRASGIFGAGTSIARVGSIPAVLHSPVQLTQEDLSRLKQIWENLNKVSLPPYLALAVGRFSSASGRQSLHDSVIDLFIAAEALFLGDDGSTSEVRHRLAHRAALLLSKDPSKQRPTFEFFRTAYDVRSKIVHGSSRLGKLPKHPNGKPMDLMEMADALRRYIREALNIMIKLQAESNGGGYPIDWTKEMFPGSEE